MGILPFVSVVVPTLNEEKYIENCLKALKNQNYKGRYEIIVADGMSRDRTAKIAKEFADKVIVVKKRGAAAERNAGAKEAEGEILLFIDADTVANFNLITEIAKAFRGKVVGTTCPILPLSSDIADFVLYYIFNEFIKASMMTKTPQVVGSLCAYKTNVFNRVNGFDEKLLNSEDWDLSKRISRLGKIKFVDSTFVLTSTRRIRKWGRARAVARYVKYYLDYVLRGKTVGVDKYRPIR